MDGMKFTIGKPLPRINIEGGIILHKPQYRMHLEGAIISGLADKDGKRLQWAVNIEGEAELQDHIDKVFSGLNPDGNYEFYYRHKNRTYFSEWLEAFEQDYNKYKEMEKIQWMG